ncbi:MAG: aminotransferase class III-fold pyridoxal phosphate-dependent enzyme, partial [Gammaproteobacteria bacterium]
DGAPEDIVSARYSGFERLSDELRSRSPRTIAAGESLASTISDVAFVKAYSVPFQFQQHVQRRLSLSMLAEKTEGTRIFDLDGNSFHDVSGSYGVNLFGYDFYKDCIERAVVAARDLGPVLGPYHPAVIEVAERLRALSGLDEVSFHMSGTEAVMQAVRLARFHTRRTHLVMFCGSYHGWWDGVQPNIGNERALNDVYVLREMSERSLRVIKERSDIACVLVNPIQVMHPNSTPPTDGMLVDSARRASVDRKAYTQWLKDLRGACDANGVVLIFDEVFVGFRLALRGAQEYFGVAADLVTYGKTLAGGLPVGVVCGKRALMKRYSDDTPGRVCFARGTFNSHPYVVCAMREFLRRLDEPDIRSRYERLDDVWNGRAAALNAQLERGNLPVRVVNLVSVWTFVYLIPGRYNWMLQFYLRAAGLSLSWVGTGRLIFSHNYSDDDFRLVCEAILAAVRRMSEDAWWWHTPGITNQSIRRAILGEMLRRRIAGILPRHAPDSIQAGASDSSA